MCGSLCRHLSVLQHMLGLIQPMARDRLVGTLANVSLFVCALRVLLLLRRS
jgi:hypothetical protein